MKPEIKALWCDALESGDYPQTTEALKDDYGYCCLGVMCDLYAKAHGLESWDKSTLGRDGVVDLPGADVLLWAGLNRENPLLDIDDSTMNASEFNDNGYSFKSIAAAIREQL